MYLKYAQPLFMWRLTHTNAAATYEFTDSRCCVIFSSLSVKIENAMELLQEYNNLDHVYPQGLYRDVITGEPEFLQHLYYITPWYQQGHPRHN